MVCLAPSMECFVALTAQTNQIAILFPPEVLVRSVVCVQLAFLAAQHATKLCLFHRLHSLFLPVVSLEVLRIWQRQNHVVLQSAILSCYQSLNHSTQNRNIAIRPFDSFQYRKERFASFFLVLVSLPVLFHQT